jgi:hypothetical protein
MKGKKKKETRVIWGLRGALFGKEHYLLVRIMQYKSYPPALAVGVARYLKTKEKSELFYSKYFTIALSKEVIEALIRLLQKAEAKISEIKQKEKEEEEPSVTEGAFADYDKLL